MKGMKANEAPEKIYLQDSISTDTVEDLWPEWFDAKVSDNSIEYIRTDVFIEKACDWLERNGSHYIGFEQGQPCVTEELIKSLKKYLEKQV